MARMNVYWNWGFGNRSTVDAVVNILRAFKKDIEVGRVAVHAGDGRAVLATFPDRYFDWVYIDSSHSYEHTHDELQILRNKVKESGVIAGDDWVPDPLQRVSFFRRDGWPCISPIITC